MVYRFASATQLRDWEESAERARLLAAGEELVASTDVQRVTGLETWFELPGRTAPAPPKWKMFVVSLCGIYQPAAAAQPGAGAGAPGRRHCACS